jgi:hypothetical protein
LDLPNFLPKDTLNVWDQLWKSYYPSFPY